MYDRHLVNLTRRVVTSADLWLLDEVIYDGLREMVGVPEDVLFLDSQQTQVAMRKWLQGKQVSHKNFGIAKERPQQVNIVMTMLSTGDHFSLLVYYRKTGELFHYDSLGKYHLSYAWQVAEMLHALSIIGDFGYIEKPNFIPVQEQNWECGYIVYAFARLIFRKRPARPISYRDLTELYPDIADAKLCLQLRRELLQFFAARRESEISKRVPYMGNGELHRYIAPS